MPVISGGRRLKPVLPEGGTGSFATRKPSAVCQFKGSASVSKTPTPIETDRRTAQILFAANLILAGRRCGPGRNAGQLETDCLAARGGRVLGRTPTLRPCHGEPMR